ncbi:hypothetical protein BC629DRAFT_1261793, partial [Irpex lacteus]
REVEAAVQSMLRQFCANIIQVSPNRKGGSMYCTLPLSEHNNVTDAQFKQTRLPFVSVQIKVATVPTWDDVFFNRFFPDRPDPNVRRQNFDKCSYFLEWETIVGRSSFEDVIKIRAALLPWWRELTWLPYSANDRMWDTRVWTDAGLKRLPSSNKGGACPKIAVNPR